MEINNTIKMSDFCKREVMALKRIIIVNNLKNVCIDKHMYASRLELRPKSSYTFDVYVTVGDIIKAVNGKKKTIHNIISSKGSKLGKIKKFKNVDQFQKQIDELQTAIDNWTEVRNYLDTINPTNCWNKLNLTYNSRKKESINEQ